MKIKTSELTGPALDWALTYYQKRLSEVQKAHTELSAKVDAFVSQFVESEEEQM
jgi:hypothetical protein